MAKSRNYLNKKDLLEEIYKSRAQDKLTKECLDMLMLLAQRTIKKLYYKCEDDKQHALSEAYYDISNNWRKFNPDFARFHGYANLEPGDEIRVYPEKGSDRTAFAVVVENYPIEDLITKTENELKSIGMKLVNTVYDEKEKVLFVNRKPTKEEILENDLPKDSILTYSIDASEFNRIKLEYIIKKNQTDIDIFDKEDIIIKDPNPFSFFTSTSINGFAKGWKKLYPNKSKGILLSIDSGFSTDGDGMHSI